MLPNWLYGKSKSKLASILGGGGGTPADYNQVKAQVNQNTEDILLLSDALDGKAGKTQITNPNILHNPWFQVNQRGATSMSTNGYFVDRWKTFCATAGSTTFTLNSDGTITIDNSLGESSAYFIQRRTSKTVSRIAGRVITASVMLSDGTVRSGTGTYVATATTNYYEDEDIKLQSVAQTAGQFLILVVAPGKSITIKALKLELGSVSTLAMDTAPDMALELMKCQRYFQRFSFISGYPFVVGFCSDPTVIRAPFQLDIEMRIPPAMSIKNIENFRVTRASTGSGVTFASMNATMIEGNKIMCLEVHGSNFAQSEVYALAVASGATGALEFDAEL